MSFREIRETTEILRTLGFPRLVSIENFRYPNFPLMAEILEWTVRKFDPIARFPKQIDSEQDRVIFVKSAVLTLLQKAHSDGYAIRELLPLLKLLYDSVKEQQKGPQKGEQDDIQISALRAQVNATRKELRQAVQMATDLPKTGANLYELLRDEIFAKDIRNKALNNSMNASQIEKEIRERIQTTEQRIVETKERLANIGNDEQELAKKNERRRRELDQLQKRLAKLQSFRPPYMDEYERYEKELKEQYAIYVVLFRNLHYLQQQLAHAEQMEREQAINAEQSMRVAVEKMRLESEQSAPVIAGIQMDGAEIEDDDEDRKQSKEVRVFGNMTGAGLSDEDEEDDDEAGGHIIEVEDEEEEGGDEHMLKQHMEEEFDEERHRSEEENSLNDF